MKIVIPLEVPQDTYLIDIEVTVESPDEERMAAYTFDENDIQQFFRFAKLAETELIK